MCEPPHQDVEALSEGIIIGPTNTTKLIGKEIFCTVYLTGISANSWVEINVNDANLKTEDGKCQKCAIQFDTSMSAKCTFLFVNETDSLFICDESSHSIWKADDSTFAIQLISPLFDDSFTFKLTYRGE